MIQEALSLASRGWRVLPVHPIREDGACGCGRPCPSPGKHPALMAWQDGATTDPAVIESWWASMPKAGVGVATGDGLLVLDIDVKPGKRGDLTLEDLEATHGRLPYSVRARTGSGGLHVYLGLPDGRSASNSSPFSGIDVRGQGGFVVAPPSPHASGGRYEWLDGGPEECPLEPAPEWLLDLLRPAFTPGEGAGPHTGPLLPQEAAARLLARLLPEAVRKAMSGESRHATWLWLANQMRDSRAPREILEFAEESFLAACRASGSGRLVTVDELRRVTRWVFSRAPRDPHPAAEPDLLPLRLAEQLNGDSRARIARSLARCLANTLASPKGPPPGVLWELVRGWNAARNTPPLPDEELEAIFLEAVQRRVAA